MIVPVRAAFRSQETYDRTNRFLFGSSPVANRCHIQGRNNTDRVRAFGNKPHRPHSQKPERLSVLRIHATGRHSRASHTGDNKKRIRGNSEESKIILADWSFD